MSRFLFLLLFILPVLLSAQQPIELKKKFQGTYEGAIPAYQLDSGKEIVDVDLTPIQIQITDKNVFLQIGKNKLSGTYTIMFEAKTYFLLDCRIDNQLAGERIVVYKKGKKISRDGLFPQPSVQLEKTKD
ncbi:MAG: hypothetical protein ACK5FX_11585 [Flavobacteriia bacterium]|jgi:hypothetical protein